jgi:putative mRNA 3-end processing factor
LGYDARTAKTQYEGESGEMDGKGEKEMESEEAVLNELNINVEEKL